MEAPDLPGHGPNSCSCIISAACLAAIRQRSRLTVEAVASHSGFSEKYLAAVERGDIAKCVEPGVIGAYERAMGTTVDAALFHVIQEMLNTLRIAHEMLSRLFDARNDQLLP